MGERQIRERAEKAALDLFRPRTEALADLSVAAEAASKESIDKVMADAAAKAEAIMENARQEVATRMDRWRNAHRAALDAGWKVSELQSEPLKLRLPPAPTKTKKGRGGGGSGHGDPSSPGADSGSVASVPPVDLGAEPETVTTGVSGFKD
ncbi:hypothetical protein SUDANB95_07872 (plasmid) [Actinosynnema sp. ALI-1.44]